MITKKKLENRKEKQNYRKIFKHTFKISRLKHTHIHTNTHTP